MSRICPQCGNVNNDTIKFCTTCGKSLDIPSDHSGPSGILQPGSPAAGPLPDPNRMLKIAGAGVAVIAIIAVFLIIAGPGIAGILPSSTPPVTSPAVTTPAVVTYPVTDTPSPGLTTVPTEPPSLSVTVNKTSTPGPTPTGPVTCPSDRRACGFNCTDIMTDVENCGACGRPCDPSQTCQQGTCLVRCAWGTSSCFDGCHDLAYDSQNCGTCGNICPVGLACNKSVCSPPLTTVIPTYIG
jgi:hypothetical protein